jgi:uncharacterized protein
MHYKNYRFEELKLSFFGGEPLMNFQAIKEIILFGDEFCTNNDLKLLLDFTTNATLITKPMLLFLSKYECMFQITLDGYEEKHNKVRFYKDGKRGTYRQVINNLYNIQKIISLGRIWVRINFDNTTLKKFPNILEDIDGLDRNKTYIIIRKIWQAQLKTSDIVMRTILHAINNGFYIDNYSSPRYDPCFADRLHQVLFNYDGLIFKCSTLEKFDNENAEGSVNKLTGEIEWDEQKLSVKMMTKPSEKCLACKIFPVCMGPCGKNAVKKGGDISCIFDSIGLSMDEFILYNYRLHYIEKSITENLSTSIS